MIPDITQRSNFYGINVRLFVCDSKSRNQAALSKLGTFFRTKIKGNWNFIIKFLCRSDRNALTGENILR